MSTVKFVTNVEKEGSNIAYVPVEVEKYEGSYGEKFFTYGYLLDSYRKIMGRVLTIIDASVVEKQQNKAMKDILRGVFSDEMEFACDMGFDQELLKEHAEKAMKDGVEVEGGVSIEEALGVESK